jgi:hypothetical protein
MLEGTSIDVQQWKANNSKSIQNISAAFIWIGREIASVPKDKWGKGTGNPCDTAVWRFQKAPWTLSQEKITEILEVWRVHIMQSEREKGRLESQSRIDRLEAEITELRKQLSGKR